MRRRGSHEAHEAASVLISKHDRENARGLLGVGRVFGPAHHVPVVVIDIPKELFASEFETAEVVLLIRVIVGVEFPKGLDLDQYASFYVQAQSCHSCRHDHLAADEGGAEVVIENTNAI